MAGDAAAPAEPSWEELRDRAVAGMDELLRVITEAHRDISEYEAALQLYTRHLRQGGRASEMGSMLDIPKIRTSFSDRLNEIESTRRWARVSLWRLQLAEGQSMAEIARAWGLSRQLISRALSSST